MNFKRDYIKWIDKYSVLAIKLVVIGLLVMLLLQILLQFDVVRVLIVPTDYWEGKPLQQP